MKYVYKYFVYILIYVYLYHKNIVCKLEKGKNISKYALKLNYLNIL